MPREPLDAMVLCAIDDEHEQLQEFVRRLHRRISGPPWNNSMVPSLLKSLVMHLETHFQNEEASGMFDAAVVEKCQVPLEVLEQLRQDHYRLLDLANQLANRCYQGPRSSHQWQQVQDMYENLQSELNRHERREYELLHGESRHDDTQDREQSADPHAREKQIDVAEG